MIGRPGRERDVAHTLLQAGLCPAMGAACQATPRDSESVQVSARLDRVTLSFTIPRRFNPVHKEKTMKKEKDTKDASSRKNTIRLSPLPLKKVWAGTRAGISGGGNPSGRALASHWR
jgi:hypothetical protein